MICDLSIEALARFARMKRRVVLGYLNIPGLLAEHLEPMVRAGWLAKSKGPSGAARDHSPLYEITDAGHSAITCIAAFTRTLL